MVKSAKLDDTQDASLDETKRAQCKMCQIDGFIVGGGWEDIPSALPHGAVAPLCGFYIARHRM